MKAVSLKGVGSNQALGHFSVRSMGCTVKWRVELNSSGWGDHNGLASMLVAMKIEVKNALKLRP